MVAQRAIWGGVLFLDRDSEFVNDDGSREDIDRERTQMALAFLEGLGLTPKSIPGRYGTEQPEYRQLFNELLPDLGIGSMDDIDLASITDLVEGIFG